MRLSREIRNPPLTVLIAILISLVLLPSFGFAQSGGIRPRPSTPAAQPVEPEIEPSGDKGIVEPIPPPAPALKTDEEVRELESLWRQQEIRHHIWSYQSRERVFEWNHKADILIFAVVMLIVLSGLVLSAVQFYIAVLAARTDAARAVSPDGSSESTVNAPAASAGGSSDPALNQALQSEVGISSSGLQVKSSVLGVVILVISLAFFYLYLDNVYPITERPGLSEATESSR